MLLGLDTATAAVSVALSTATGEILAVSNLLAARGHGEWLGPAIVHVLAESGVRRDQLTGVAVGVGPGPFTSLRVGLVTATVLGHVLSVPVHGVCTLDAIALAAGRADTFRVVTDARRREVYWATYDGVTRVDGPHVSRPGDIVGDLPAVGAGARLYPGSFAVADEPLDASAAAVCGWVTGGLPVLEPVPLYLRRPDADEPGARKKVLG